MGVVNIDGSEIETDMVEGLLRLADEIETGKRRLDRVIIVLDGSSVEGAYFGKPATHNEIIGALNVLAIKIATQE